MKTRWTYRLFTAALGALLWSAAILPAHAAEKGGEANVKAPAAVMTAFQKAYPNASIRDISKEIKDGKTYYEIESMDGAQRRDLLYLADGTVFEIEEAVKVGDLPEAITGTLSAKFPKGKLQKAERITRGSIIQYEVLMENGEENLEVLLDANGKVVSQASAQDEDEKAEGSESDEADED